MRFQNIILISLLVLFLFASSNSQRSVTVQVIAPQNSGNVNNQDINPISVDNGQTAIDMIEVAKHNSVESCYTVIDNKVYDLTKWIPQHPGGEAAILSICGKDGTEIFRGQHDHNQKQEDILQQFLIGDLKL